MADQHNIRLPDGTTLSIPAWASDVTMSNLARQMDLNLDFQNALFKEIKGLIVNGEELTTAVKRAQDQDVKQREQIAKEEVKARKQFAKTLIKRTNDIVGRLSDTEKPLTTGIDMLGEFKDSLGNNKDKAADGKKKLSIFQRIMKIAGSTANLGADASLAYAGFMAAKLEEFAKAQTNMIDAGAIFYDSASEFDTMFRDARSLGITYNAFSEIVSQYGSALQGLGTGVSDGTTVFMDTFKAVDTLGENLGDFGLRSQQIAQGLAEYINVQRLTGAVDRNTIDASEKLSQGFSDLMVETTALAQLTGKSRNKIIQDRLAVQQDANVVAALNMVREASGSDAADQMSSIFDQLADISDEMPEQSQLLIQAIAKEAMSRQGEVEGFDIRTFLTESNPAFMAILDQNSPIIDNINNAISTGEGLATDNESFIVKGFAELDLSAYNFQQMVGQGNSDFFNNYMELQKGQMLIQRNHKNRITKSDQEYQQYVTDTEGKLGESSEITETMNEVTQQFLQAQDALTFPINEASKVASGLAEALEDMADYFDREDTLSTDAETPDQAMTRQREAAMAENQLMAIPVAPSMSEEEMRRQGSMTPAPDPNQFLMDKVNSFPTARYMGGEIRAGQEYMVGELGAEKFVSGEKGYMYSHKDTLKMFQEETAAVMKAARAVSDMYQASQKLSNGGSVIDAALSDVGAFEKAMSSTSNGNLGLTGSSKDNTIIDDLISGMVDVFSPMLSGTNLTNEFNLNKTVSAKNTSSYNEITTGGSTTTYTENGATVSDSPTTQVANTDPVAPKTTSSQQVSKPATPDLSNASSGNKGETVKNSLAELQEVKKRNVELAAELAALVKTFKAKNRSSVN